VRLLVTNTRVAQAYAIVRALRPHAERLVATTSGPRPLGIWPTCHAAFSRLVDRRYAVPDPESDWAEGRIQPENTPREQAFVDAVLEICERERIDTVFPSSDPWIYVFSKNRERFSRHGILIPVPDYEVVTKPLDKYRSVECAREVGFPAPLSFLASSDTAVREIVAKLPPPWVIKRRFTSGGRGLAVVSDADELRAKTALLRQHHGAPIVQEYVPGRERQNFYLVLDRSGRAVSALTPKILRYAGRVFRSSCVACESVAPHHLVDQAVRLVRHMGWWGGATVQTKIDARDGLPKLMEVNPRLGTHLWYRTALGVNEPLLCLKIARGEQVDPVIDYPLGCVLLQPIEDVADLAAELVDLGIYRLRTGLLGKAPLDPANPPLSLRERFASLRAQYAGGRERLFSPYVRYGIEDPLPALIWTSKVFASRSQLLIRGLGK